MEEEEDGWWWLKKELEVKQIWIEVWVFLGFDFFPRIVTKIRAFLWVVKVELGEEWGKRVWVKEKINLTFEVI